MRRPIDLKTFTQPYKATLAEMQDLLRPVRTSVQLADIDDEINTKDKSYGRMVFDSTLGIPVFASWFTPVSTWLNAAGTPEHNPS